MDSVSERVYQIVAGIPKGKVMSYGQIGVIVGIGPRQVGRILHLNPYPSSPFVRGRGAGVPCHRVVRSDGSLATGFAFGGPKKQRELLEKEGVKFKNGKVARFCQIGPIR
ncbi:MGMT family protein [Candidatus Collierbacteria bacterium]|nr:MGMT family protein [Candidatus Collierbacteria bacterium]